MCGLAGYLSPTVLPEEVLVRMTTRLGHRGPDAEGYFRDGPVALGHRRLSVLDIEGSPQPMSTPDGALTCIFNGEIYNFAALRGARPCLPYARRYRGAALRIPRIWHAHARSLAGHVHVRVVGPRRTAAVHRPRPPRREAPLLPLGRHNAGVRLRVEGDDRASGGIARAGSQRPRALPGM